MTGSAVKQFKKVWIGSKQFLDNGQQGVRDWSLIREKGGGLQDGKITGPKYVVPPSPIRQVKKYIAPCPHEYG